MTRRAARSVSPRVPTSRSAVALSFAVAGALSLVSCSDDGGDGEASQEEICADVQSFADAIENIDASENQDDALVAFDQAADAAEAMSDTAPGEISDDVDLLATGLRALATAETDEEVGEALETLDQDALDAAGERFEAYSAETCDIDF